MKFVTDQPLADPDAAARKLLALANTVEPVQNSRIYVEKINGPFLFSSGARLPNTRPALIAPSPRAGSCSTRAGPM